MNAFPELDSLPREIQGDGFSAYRRKRKVSLNAPFIPVMGTNGKSSTAWLLSNILTEGGYKVGLLSTCLFPDVCSAIKINGKSIEKEAFAAFLKENCKDFGKFDLCQIEAIIAIGLLYFAQEKPDVIVLDMDGGEFFPCLQFEEKEPLLSILTSVDLDDTYFHGTTLSSIAASFVSFLPDGANLLIARMEENVEAVLGDEMRERRGNLHKVNAFHSPHLVNGRFHFDYFPYKDLVLNSLASIQLRNASLVLEALTLLKDFPVSEEAIRKGLLHPGLPCREEKIGLTIFDCSDNPASIEAIIPSFFTLSGDKPLHILFACPFDKNIAVMLPELDNAASEVTLTTLPFDGYRKEEDFFLYTADHPFIEDPVVAYNKLREQFPEDPILITGCAPFAFYLKEKLHG